MQKKEKALGRTHKIPKYIKPDRRKYTRIQKPFLVRYRPRIPLEKGKKSSRWNIVPIQNISAEGILFKLDKKLEVGTLIDLKIHFPGFHEPIECVARVYRSKKQPQTRLFHITALFTAISAHERELIQKTAERIFPRTLNQSQIKY